MEINTFLVTRLLVGGQPFYATAGGKNSAGIEKALAQAKTYIH